MWVSNRVSSLMSIVSSQGSVLKSRFRIKWIIRSRVLHFGFRVPHLGSGSGSGKGSESISGVGTQVESESWGRVSGRKWEPGSGLGLDSRSNLRARVRSPGSCRESVQGRSRGHILGLTSSSGIRSWVKFEFEFPSQGRVPGPMLGSSLKSRLSLESKSGSSLEPRPNFSPTYSFDTPSVG